jgi:hypothetical protein
LPGAVVGTGGVVVPVVGVGEPGAAVVVAPGAAERVPPVGAWDVAVVGAGPRGGTPAAEL